MSTDDTGRAPRFGPAELAAAIEEWRRAALEEWRRAATTAGPARELDATASARVRSGG